MSNEKVTERVEVAVHRTVKVMGVDDRPAVELTGTTTAGATQVSIALLPRNSSRRSPVRIEDLESAVAALKGGAA